MYCKIYLIFWLIFQTVQPGRMVITVTTNVLASKSSRFLATLLVVLAFVSLAGMVLIVEQIQTSVSCHQFVLLHPHASTPRVHTLVYVTLEQQWLMEYVLVSIPIHCFLFMNYVQIWKGVYCSLKMILCLNYCIQNVLVTLME